jgi:hypothetical protein
MNILALRAHNSELFFDGITEGAIDYSYIRGVLPVGGGQPNPMITSFTGGPYLPVNNKLSTNRNTWTYGSAGNYPRPFLSFSQKLTNANYSYLGAYARLISYHLGSLSKCINDECELKQDGTDKSIWGRVGVIQSGYGIGQLGFFAQPWYLANDGTYDAAFWAERYTLEIPDKPTWWDQCTKLTTTVIFFNDVYRETCVIEVAFQNLQFDDKQYYKGEPLHSIQDGTLGLLPQLVGLASAIGWI